MPLRTTDDKVAFAVHYVDAAPPTPMDPIDDVALNGPLTLLGYTRRDLALWTYWRVETVPDRPLSLMAHLIGPDGTAIAVGDGLGFPIEQWQPGDVIVQFHTLVMPEDAAPGTYTIQTGAYWLDTMERWTTDDGASHIVVREIDVEP